MSDINLNNKQVLLYSEFLLALPDEEYMAAVDTTKVGCTLYSGVVEYARLHYPQITIA